MKLYFPFVSLGTIILMSKYASTHQFLHDQVPLLPNCDYLNFLNFDAHNRCMLPAVYSLRHFWNHMAIIKLSLTPDMTEGKHFFHWLSSRVANNQQQDGPWRYLMASFDESSVDESSINDFNVFLSQFIIKPCNPYPQLYSTIECKTLDEVFYHEFLLWGMPLCVVDMYVRNLLIVIYRFLCRVFGSLFDQDNLQQYFTLLYNTLTDYNRFAQCGNRNMYSSWLALADATFCSPDLDAEDQEDHEDQDNHQAADSLGITLA
jgi:hypothetical protein